MSTRSALVGFSLAALAALTGCDDTPDRERPQAAQPDAATHGERDADAQERDADAHGKRDADAHAERDADVHESRDADAHGPRDADASHQIDTEDAGAQQASARLRVVLFSRTTGYRHTSIEPAQQALASRLDSARYTLRKTEDAAELIQRLPETDVVVFLMTTGDVLNDAQQDAFEHFMRGGGGFVGVHSAADTEYDWPFYGELIVGWFASHPVVQEARVVVQAPEDGVVSFLPNPWQHRDEWYNFRVNPRGRAKILLSVDETSYGGGTMGQDHPIAWHRELGRGRALYTALGHPDEAWQEAALLQHIEAALRWAGHRTDSMPSPTPADARAP